MGRFPSDAVRLSRLQPSPTLSPRARLGVSARLRHDTRSGTAMGAMFAAASRRKVTRAPADSAVHNAEKPLGLIDLTLLGVGGTLGSGLFLLAGRAARDIAGPAVTVSFALAGIACIFSGLSYAEMASRHPSCGGAYSFAYAAIGELPAFICGMCLFLEYSVSSAAIARSWAAYLGEAVEVLPSWVTGRSSEWSLLASLLVLGIALLLSGGMKEAKWVINIATALYALVVAMIVGVGSQKVDRANWQPFMPFGIKGLLQASSAVFFAYVGFDEVATVAEEARDAATTVPLAIMLSLLIVSCMYVVATLVLTGVVKYTDIDFDTPFSAAFRTSGAPVIAKLVGVGTAIGMMNTATVSLAAQPRIFFSMGRDGLLPSAFAESMRYTTLGCGVVVSLLALIVPTQALADVVSGGTLLAFLSTNIALLLTRFRLHSRSTKGPFLVFMCAAGCGIAGILIRLGVNGKVGRIPAVLIAVPVSVIPALALGFSGDFRGGIAHERISPSFLCPWVPLLPMLGVFTTCFLLSQLSAKALSALGVWLILSCIFYFCYGARHSKADHAYSGDGLGSADTNRSYNSFASIPLEANSYSSSGSIPDSPPVSEGLL